MMIIGAVFRLVKQAWRVKLLTKRYQNVLVPGRYYISENFRSVCLSDSVVKGKAEMCFPKGKPMRTQCRLARILNKLNFYNIGRHKENGDYEAVYIANNNEKTREVKLFSFSKKKILTICVSNADAERQLREYESLSNVYKMPAVSRNVQFENALDVSMIDRLQFPGEEQALTTIVLATASHIQNTDEFTWRPVKELLSFSYENETINAYLTDLLEDIHPDILAMNLPVCVQHGDLSKDNLIFGEAEGERTFWWIDWEHIKERVFFYDYFFYIINSAMYTDSNAFNNYISGRQDAVLKKFFSDIGIIFAPDKKWDYFLVFAIVFLIERVCDLGNVNALIRYCELIDQLKKIRDGINL